MIRARTSMMTLIVVVGLTAVGFAALRVSSRLWASAGFSAALLGLMISVAGMIYRRGSVRAFFAGFALFGWTYFILSFGPSPVNAWRDSLVTTPILSILEERLLEVPTSTTRVPPVGARPGPSSRLGAYPTVELSPWTHWTDTDRSNPFSNDSFSRIGHSLFCIGIAFAGGVFCRWLHDSRVASSPSP